VKTFLHQFYFEVFKLAARKRTHLGFVIFLLAELLILWLLRMSPTQHRFTQVFSRLGHTFDPYLSGLTLAFLLISFTTFFLGTIFLALIAGDMVAKEVEDGTLRMVLSRPVSRLRVLAVKYLACLFYSVVLSLFIIASSLMLGIVTRGAGGMVALAPAEHILAFYEPAEAWTRFGWSAVTLCLCAPTVASMAFMFSCFRLKPATATVLTLSFFFMDSVLRQVPYFEPFKGYFLTQYTTVWIRLFEPEIDWAHIGKSLLLLALLDAAFFGAGAAYFCRRDFKS
jgi:ABC-2 type transport system permease protein